MRTRQGTPVALLCTTLLMGGSQMAAVRPARAIMMATGAPVQDVQVTHDHYTAHVQPSIAINPRDSRNLLGTALLFQAQHGPYVGTFASFDGGRTWRDNGPLPLPRGTDSSDVPSVAFDSQGRGFVVATAVSTSDLNIGSDQHTCVCLWRTHDGGRTFRPPVAVARGQAVDHPWIAVARSQGTIYVVWRSKRPDGIAFSRSIDGGRSFSRSRIVARVPNGGAFVPMIGAGPGGSVFVVYDAQANPKRGSGKQSASPGGLPVTHVDVVSSADGGVHFGRPKQLTSAPESISPSRHLAVLTPPAIAVGTRDGSVYVTYARLRGGSSTSEIVLRRSLDGGRSWSAPVPVTNGPPSGSTADFQPAVALDGLAGVDVSFLALTGGRIDVWLARSVDHGTSFRSVHRVTVQSFNPALGLHHGGASGSWWIGDYQGLTAGGGHIYPIWSDTHTGHLEIASAAIPARQLG